MPNGRRNRSENQRDGQNIPYWNIKKNPYNFVRFSERIVEKDEEGNLIPIPDHSIFTGNTNTGYIECSLTNETPLFCGGKIKNPEADHKNIKFFRLNDKLAIPSTSLKGMIRSFIEALTGSCLPIVDTGVLSRRMFVKPNMSKCGKVIRMATSDQSGQIQEMKKIRVPIDEVNNNNYEDKVKFRITERYPPTAHINSEQQGLLKKNNKNIETKNYERIFYQPIRTSYEFSRMELATYNRIVETHKTNWKRMNIVEGVEPTNFHKLKVGDLVYFQVDNGYAVQLCYVEVPRLAYKNSIGYLLEKNISSNCCTVSNPCLPCRLFGYIKDKNAKAGRVSFSHAIIPNNGQPSLVWKTLKPLGKPNPTSCNFYLIDTQNNDTVRDYNGAKIEPHGGSFGPSGNDIQLENVHLRGRKFYWHHKNGDIIGRAHCDIQTKLNSTVEIMKEGNTFNFRVYFNNLTDFELGLLLYSLKLEDNLRHKLGMAKNLGFGTVKIKIEKLFVDNLKKKYNNLVGSDYREDWTNGIDDLINNTFKGKIKNFDNLLSVEDLRKILNPQEAPQDLGYPEESDGKNYRWYMSNKNVPLPLLQEQGKKYRGQ